MRRIVHFEKDFNRRGCSNLGAYGLGLFRAQSAVYVGSYRLSQNVPQEILPGLLVSPTAPGLDLQAAAMQLEIAFGVEAVGFVFKACDSGRASSARGLGVR